jgi:hypothetical protein
MLITFFDIKGTVHLEFNSQGQTVNTPYYVEVLKQIPEAVRRKRPELWPSDWILHCNDAPVHKALSDIFWSKNRLLKWNTHQIPLT